ncbi:exported hypothetical protein [uncultured Thiomicrorhabdus sp.]
MWCQQLRRLTKLPLIATLFSALAMLSGCSSVQVEDYADKQPKLDLFDDLLEPPMRKGNFKIAAVWFCAVLRLK